MKPPPKISTRPKHLRPSRRTKSYLHDLYRELRNPEFAIEYVSQAASMADPATLSLAVQDVISALMRSNRKWIKQHD